MIIQQNLSEKACFIAKMFGSRSAIVRLGSSDFWKAP